MYLDISHCIGWENKKLYSIIIWIQGAIWFGLIRSISSFFEFRVSSMKMTINDDDQDADDRGWWGWQLMMMMLVGTSGVMQRLQCHGRNRSSQLFTRETETDGYNYHKIPHQMKMLMIIILCCIVTTTRIITKVKVTTWDVQYFDRKTLQTSWSSPAWAAKNFTRKGWGDPT